MQQRKRSPVVQCVVVKCNKGHVLQSYYDDENSGCFQRVSTLDVHLVMYSPLQVSSYIELPKPLALKKAILNVKNSRAHQNQAIREKKRFSVRSLMPNASFEKKKNKRLFVRAVALEEGRRR